jgi:recombination protein RecT
MTSLLSIVNNNSYLRNASPDSIYTSAMMAAALDLPINPNLGFAYIIPYGQQAQFQIGYKGLIQLALRSGQFKTISVTPVYEGQLLENNPLTGFKFDFNVKVSDKVIGYASYFSLINGYEKTMYMSVQEVEAHGKKYSKTFSNGVWKNDFNAMAQKTCLKLLLSKYAPLSIEMQKAVMADQAVIKNVEDMEVEYVDNGTDNSEVKEQVSQIATARIDKLKSKTND